MTWRPALSRLTRIAAACALVAGLAFLAVPSAAASGGSGWLRLAHLSPNTPAVDVYLYAFDDPTARVVLRHVRYGTVSGYEHVAAGEYTVAMRAAGASPTSKPVLSTTVDVQPGHAYTVAGMGQESALRLQVIDDRLTTPAGHALVRVIQASMRQHRVTVTAGSTLLASKLAFASVTSYQAVAPGSWRVRAAGPSEHAAATITLAAGSIHTLVILDDPGHLTITDLEDSAGSAADPGSAPATGFGGTAPQPAAPVLPWLITAAAGLLIAGTGIWRLRTRPRRAAQHAR